MPVPQPPVFSSYRQCFETLRDTGFWEPYVHAVLVRHHLQPAAVEVGAEGQYPTFLVGDVVVKLFVGIRANWREDSATELAMYQCVSDRAGVPVPHLLAHGRLYDGADPWPYLVTERLTGAPWRDASLTRRQRLEAAHQLGTAVRTLHNIPVPDVPIFATSWLVPHRPDRTDQHRRRVLPTHLADQIDRYVIQDWPLRCLVHADLTEDHVFVTGRGQLVGVIDWGDAQATDPHYELAPLHVLTFGGDKELLVSFLDGYGWELAADFIRRAMSAALLHRKFSLFSAIDALRPLDTFANLDELASYLWDIDE
jgi:hygromycin-B 7''-O-kinase